MVYGPQGNREKVQFLSELRTIKSLVGDKWLLLGDFNLILQASDKSNDNLNKRLVGEFRSTNQFSRAQGVEPKRKEVHLVKRHHPDKN